MNLRSIRIDHLKRHKKGFLLEKEIKLVVQILHRSKLPIGTGVKPAYELLNTVRKNQEKKRIQRKRSKTNNR
jgi:hypothetical protein